MSVTVLFLVFVLYNYHSIIITCFPSNLLKGVGFSRQHYRSPSLNWIFEHNRNYFNNLKSRSKNDLRWAKKESNEDLRSLSEKELLEMDLSQLIEMIRKEDSEWLDSVLGIEADEIEKKQPANNESVPESVKINIEEEIKTKLELGNDSIPNTFSDVRVEDPFVREKDRFTDEIKTTSNNTEEETFTQNNLAQSQHNALKNLGYTDTEIACMKASVVAMVQEGEVRRPGSKDTPLPRQWFKAGSNPYVAMAAEDNTQPIPSTETTQQRPKRKPLSVKPDRRYEVKGSDEENEGDEVGSAVRWRRSAAPSQDERKEAIAAAVTRDVKRRFDSPVSSRSTDPDNDNDEYDDDDDDNDSDDDREFSFWPSEEEFKDLLLDESRMRVEIVGDWMTPYVKEETKWRYRIYKDWLRFLEDGFGDAFDVVEDAFEEDSGGVEPSPGSEDAMGRSRNPSTIREKLVSRDDPSYSAAASLRSGDQGPPVSIPVLKSEVKKVRALLDNAAGTSAAGAGRKTVSAPTAPASRKGSRAALYDEYIRKIADAQQSSQFQRVKKQKIDDKVYVVDDDDDEKEEENGRREVYDWFDDADDDNDDEKKDSVNIAQRKRKMNAPENSRSSINNSIAEDQGSSGGRAPKTVLKNEEESVDSLDEIDYINIRNPRRTR